MLFMKREIEEMRSGNMWGALFWMYNDIWPASAGIYPRTPEHMLCSMFSHPYPQTDLDAFAPATLHRLLPYQTMPFQLLTLPHARTMPAVISEGWPFDRMWVLCRQC